MDRLASLFMEDIAYWKWRFESFLIFKFQITQKRELIARNGKRYRNQREKYFLKRFRLFMFMAKINNLFSSELLLFFEIKAKNWKLLFYGNAKVKNEGDI